MKSQMEIYIKNIALDQFRKSNMGFKFQKAIDCFEIIQAHIEALSEKEGEEKTTIVKMITIVTFSILKKFAGGKKPTDLSKEDWKDIASAISEDVILKKDEEYTQYIFEMYVKYIRFSVEQIEVFASEKVVKPIIELADELDNKGRAFTEGEIGEVEYIEDSLWICLDAMMKLIAAASSKFLNEDNAEFTQALASYAFEYGRLVLYKREEELLDELIQKQYMLDIELENKYQEFIAAIEEQSKQFYVLIENAFIPNYRESFLHSIILAQAVGISGKEVLKDINDVDEFFM